MQRARPSLTYANVMATLAVFVVLGGGAYAATRLPKNSVGASQIRDNAITSPKVKNGSLLKQDFKAGQLPGGPQGLPGAPGQKGDAGPTGPAGPTASASASSGGPFNVPLTNTVTPTAPVQAQITTTFRSRLVATGTASMKDTAAETAPGDVGCVLSIDQPPPSVATGARISQQVRARLPVSSTSEHSAVAVTGESAVLPPGTYFVGLHCLSFSGHDATADAADVTVIAVGG